MTLIGLDGANLFEPFYYHAGRALLIKNMLSRILALPGAKALPRDKGVSVGAALNVMRDDVESTLGWSADIVEIIALVLTGRFAFWIMLSTNVWVTLGTFVPLLVIVLIAERMSKRIERVRQVSRESTGRVSGTLGDMFGAVQAIQVNDAEEQVVAHFRSLNEERRQAMVQDRLFTGIVDLLAENTVTIGTGLVLLFSAIAMQNGSFSVGDFALFVAYIWPVTEMMRSFGTLIAGYKQAGVSVDRMQMLMQGAPPQALTEHGPVYLTGDLPPVPVASKRPEDRLSLLEVSDLSYQHGEDRADGSANSGIRDVDLVIERGSFTVITGRIGSGKSTLLHVLIGLLPKSGGEIRWNGTPVDDPDRFFAPPRSAYTPQTPRPFSQTLLEYILLGVPENAEALDEANRRTVLEEDIAGMEDGLATPVGPRGLRLSGRQVQRTAAARMFVRQPELLVFDDLSSALGVETEQQL